MGRFARNLLLKWALPGNSNERWLKSENLRLVVLSHAHSEPTLQQAPALGPPASVDTQTALEDGRGRGHEATWGHRASGASVLDHVSLLHNLVEGGGRVLPRLCWKTKVIICSHPKLPFAIRKRPRKGRGFPKVTRIVNRWGTPGRRKDFLVRNAIYVFCCVFIFIFK